MEIDAKTLQAFQQLVSDKAFGDGLMKFLKQVPWIPKTYITNLQLVHANYTGIKQREELIHSPWAVDEKLGMAVGMQIDASMNLSFAAARLQPIAHSKVSLFVDFVVFRSPEAPEGETPSVALALTYRKADTTFLNIVTEPVDVKYGQTTRYTFSLEARSVDPEMLFEAVVGVTPMNDCVVFVRGVWLGQDV